MAERVTLDTNLLVDLWRDRVKRDRTDKLLELQRQGNVELAVTGHIRDDITYGELAERLNELPELPIAETGGVFRLDISTLGGPDVLGNGGFDDFLHSDDYAQIRDRLLREGKLRKDGEPDQHDWLHLHAHFVHGRDTFLTWDKGLLAFAPTLAERFGLVVESPDAFLDRSMMGATGL